MRRTIFVFAVVASLLMLACSAKVDDDSIAVLVNGATDIAKTLTQHLFENTGTKVTLSNLFGLLDDKLEESKSYERDIGVLHQQSLKEYKDIESISALVQADAAKYTESGELTQMINFIATRAETGKTEISKIEKDIKTIKSAIADAEAVKQAILKSDNALTQLVIEMVKVIPDFKAARTFGTNVSDPLKVTVIQFFTSGIPIALDLYSSSKKFKKAITQSNQTLQDAKLASKTIKQYLTESQELQKFLKPQI